MASFESFPIRFINKKLIKHKVIVCGIITSLIYYDNQIHAILSDGDYECDKIKIIIPLTIKIYIYEGIYIKLLCEVKIINSNIILYTINILIKYNSMSDISYRIKKSLLKIILLGDAAVGKTSLMNQYVKQRFYEKYKTTIGADFLTKELTIDNKMITLQIWDTAGQERFASLGTAFYRGSDCCILVYDMSNPLTIKNLEIWRKEFLSISNVYNTDTFPFILVGNKSDINDEDNSEIEDFINKYNIKFFKTSAKENKNVEIIFRTAAELAIKFNNNAIDSIDYNFFEQNKNIDYRKFIEKIEDNKCLC